MATTIRLAMSMVLLTALCMCVVDAQTVQSPQSQPSAPSIAVTRSMAPNADVPSTRVTVYEGDEKGWVEKYGVLITVAAGFLGLIIQAWLQHKTKLGQQNADKANELRMTIYNDIGAQCTKISKARLLGQQLGLLRHSLDELAKEQARQPRERADRFSNGHTAHHMAVIDLIIALERWDIALPNFQVLRLGLSVALYDNQERFQPLYHELMRILPFGREGELNFVPARAPTAEKRAEIEKLYVAYVDTTSTLSSYVDDVLTECQNHLLRELFDGNAKTRRSPLDPRLKVLITSPSKEVDALRTYFENETAYGKHKAEVEARVKSTLDVA